MLIDLTITLSIISFILYLYISFKKYKESQCKITQPLTNLFSSCTYLPINIFQHIQLFPSNDLFDYFVSILSLKKMFDLMQIFNAEKEKLILKGKIKKTTNTAIIKKTCKLDHLVTKYTNKQKMGDSRYKVYGNKDMYEFVEKYDVDIFYISYLPSSFVREARFERIFYLEVAPENVCIEFYAEMFDILKKMRDSSDERVKEVKKRFETDLGCEIMKMNIKKNQSELEKNGEVNAEKRKKRKEKRGKMIIRK